MITKLLAPRDSASPIASFNPAHRDMFRLMLPQISASLRINTNRESRLPPYRVRRYSVPWLAIGPWMGCRAAPDSAQMRTSDATGPCDNALEATKRLVVPYQVTRNTLLRQL